MARYFSVFGDVHGRVALMLTISRLWELESGTALAGILQVGDMGAFPDHGRLDKSTAKFAAKDRDELGYREFVETRREGTRFLGDLSAPDVVWVRGNHEDFEHLAQFGVPSYVDAHDHLLYLPDGSSIDFPARHDRARPLTRIAGFGGIPPSMEDRGEGRHDREQFRRAQHKALTDPRRFTLEQAAAALNRETEVDVLMSHAGPRTDEFHYGSQALAKLAARVRPRVYLFGHHHVVLGPTEGPGGCLLVGLEHLEFDRSSKQLREGSCGLLRFADPDDDEPDRPPEFRFFEPEFDPWWFKVRRKNYRDLFTGWDD